MALAVGTLTFDDVFTFTRASTAWYYDSAGDYQSATTDTPRIDHDPGRRNLVEYSEDLTYIGWSKLRVSLGTSIARNGISLDEIVEDSSTNTHIVMRVVSTNAGATVTWSAYVVAKTRTQCRFEVYEQGNYSLTRCYFFVDLSDGSISSPLNVGASATNADASVIDEGSGLYRLTLTMAAPGATTYAVVLYLSEGGTSSNYAGDGVSSLYAGGFQLEESSTATDYIRTTNAARCAPRGLALEGAGTNLVLYSEDLSNGAWNKSNVTVGTPRTYAGNISLDEVVESADSSSQFHFLTQSQAVTSGAIVTFSCYVAANGRDEFNLKIQDVTNTNSYSGVFDLTSGTASSGAQAGTATDTNQTIAYVGEGVYRVSVTASIPSETTYLFLLFLRDATGASYIGDGVSGIYAGGFQVEERPFATSYIPTTSAQVTRAVETCFMDTSPWLCGAADGTFAVEFMTAGYRKSPDVHHMYAFRNTANTQKFRHFVNNVNHAPRVIANLTSAIYDNNAGLGGAPVFVLPFEVGRTALAHYDTRAALSAAGEGPRIEVPVAWFDRGEFDTGELGKNNGTNPMYGWLRAFRYERAPMTDAELVAESADYADENA